MIATRRLVLYVSGTAVCLGLIVATLRADMMKDSPVTFPAKGALPSKYPPDVRTKREVPEKDYAIFGTPRTLAGARSRRSRPRWCKGTFTPPKPDWTHLNRTHRILTEGGELASAGDGRQHRRRHDALGLGGETGGGLSQGEDPRHGLRPRRRRLPALQGGGPHREERRAAQTRPGVHRRHQPEGHREHPRGHPPVAGRVCRTSRSCWRPATFGTTDPRSPEELAKDKRSGASEYGVALKKLAAEEDCAFLNMTEPWVEYMRSTKVHPHVFYRDRVHANEYRRADPVEDPDGVLQALNGRRSLGNRPGERGHSSPNVHRIASLPYPIPASAL